uniref:COMM domain containing 10 n=1 Tax=Pavo cristatus TaxID=9049 RepID=A0A8C9L8V8_PAVCR
NLAGGKTLYFYFSSFKKARWIISWWACSSVLTCLMRLETIGWQLNLQMSASTQAKLKSPRAVLELGVSNEDSKNLKKVFVEFSHQELFEFYNKLETIQAQLDSLT